MSAGIFSEWRKLPVSLSELCINTTLRCGQSFRWHNVPDTDEWRCVLHGRILSLRQDPKHLFYRSYPSSKPPLPTPPNSHPPSREDSTGSTPQSKSAENDGNYNTHDSTHDDTLSLIKHYFNLSSNLTNLYSQWSSQDPNFRKKAPQFTGVRILRQDAWEALVSFICSSNNNISRISQMVEKLCVNYGPFIGSVDGRAYHDFPSPEALAGDAVELHLRSLGFGYRAKYIYQTALVVAKEREENWIDTLRNPECPAFGVEATPGNEMKVEGRQGYRDAHEKLLELQGVGPKVADCVCLMGLGWGEAVPVDTHVWQIAQRDYKFSRNSSNKTLNKATYDAVGSHFRKLWGKEAGWAHSVLFTADLRTFSDRLITASKETKNAKVSAEVDVDVKQKNDDQEVGIYPKTKTTTTAMTAVKREMSEDKLDKKGNSSSTTKVQSSQTTAPRRTSKRLRTT